MPPRPRVTDAAMSVDEAPLRAATAGPLASLALAVGANVALWASDALWAQRGLDDSVASLLWLSGWVLLVPAAVTAVACAVVLLRHRRARPRAWGWPITLLVACAAMVVFAVLAHLPWGAGAGSA